MNSSCEPKPTENRGKKRWVNATNVEAKVAKSGASCWFCSSKDHRIGKCRRFLDFPLTDKWKWVKEQRHCFKCFGSAHLQSACKAPNFDKKSCGRPHHLYCMQRSFQLKVHSHLQRVIFAILLDPPD